MAQTNTAGRQQGGKKLQYRKVSFDVTEIAPDAPAGEWQVSIPRGKCKVQPTQKDNYPMLIVAVRLDSTEEEGEEFEKALGVELPTFLVFGSNTTRGERLNKIRVQQLCKAADVDLDVIPKEIGEDPENELEPLIRALEGAKFTAWTKLQTRKDTGEVVSELLFQDPDNTLSARGDDDDDEGDDEEDGRRARRGSNGASRSKKKASKKKSSRSTRR